MPTAKQTAANRMNSQKSTGPGATQGQSASRYNAAKHGIDAQHQIMFDETAGDLAGLADEYHQHHSPADPGQRFLVDTLINSEWRLRRLRRVEAELWEHATNTFLANHTEAAACSSGDAFATASPVFERLQRVVNSCERTYHRALKVARGHALRSSQPEAAPDPAPQPEQSAATSAKMGSVRQNPKTPPPAAPKPPASEASAKPPDAPPAAPPLAGQHAPATPANPSPRPSDRFPTPVEAMDAALKAILNQK
jgi:hypothetical protein